MRKMPKRTKGLLVALGVLLVIGCAVWIFFNGGVSADVNGTNGETDPNGASTATIVKIDDGETTVNPGQILNYTISVDMSKMFEQLSDTTNPTKEQFDAWMSQNGNDQLYVNAWLGDGRSSSNGAWIMSNPNFTVTLPKLTFPLATVNYTATATVPSNVDLTKHQLQNIARLVRRPCRPATTAEIARSLFNVPKLDENSLVCPMKGRSIIQNGQNIDIDTLSLTANTPDLSMVTFTGDGSVIAGEYASFSGSYRNANQIAGGVKIKVRFPENTFTIDDGQGFTAGTKETVDGVNYDVYWMKVGDLPPTVNGTPRTDAATINSITAALTAAKDGNTNASLVRSIENALTVNKQYVAGVKTIADLVAAVNAANTAAVNAQTGIANESNATTLKTQLLATLTIPAVSPNETAYINTASSLVDQYLAGTVRLSAVNGAIRNLDVIHHTSALSVPIKLIEDLLAGLPDKYVVPNFGIGTVNSLAQAVSATTSLSASASSPASPIQFSFQAKALVGATGKTVKPYAEITSTSTDSNPDNNGLKMNQGVTVIDPANILQ
jgi:hypothetical protein